MTNSDNAYGTFNKRTTIFSQIDESLRPAIARRYIEKITAHMKGKASEILQDYEKEFASKSDFLKNIKPKQKKVQFSSNTNIFFENDWKNYQKDIEKIEVNLFKNYDKIEK